MKKLLDFREPLVLVRDLVGWSLFVAPVGMLAGSASALFLWSLDRVTEVRWEHGWLIYLLPLAGVAIALVYSNWGGKAGEGNNLILDSIHEPGAGVPRRMAPMILMSTLLTHLFGGSAGREGTAVQMGGSLASAYGRVFGCKGESMRILLLAGVAAGFGSVFGTPLAGAIFAIEVLAVGKMRYDALIPVMVASFVGDWTCHAWGVGHVRYSIALVTPEVGSFFDLGLIFKVALAAVVFGVVSRFFTESLHFVADCFRRWIRSPWMRPLVGALLVIALVHVLGTRDYLGIGVTNPEPDGVSLVSAFEPGGVRPLSWFWKIVFTAITLGAGFKGGEVTPIFFVGATLGAVLGGWMGAPVDLFAGLGFVAVFAGAANTPLACTLMGIELFGAENAVPIALACFISYQVTGHTGIYLSQRLGQPKRSLEPGLPEISIREVREIRGGKRPVQDR